MGEPRPRPFAELCTRVYTRAGKRAHLVQSSRDYATLCGDRFWAWPGELLGTGSQREYETAAALPLCRYCEAEARRRDPATPGEVIRRLAELLTQDEPGTGQPRGCNR